MRYFLLVILLLYWLKHPVKAQYPFERFKKIKYESVKFRREMTSLSYLTEITGSFILGSD